MKRAVRKQIQQRLAAMPADVAARKSLAACSALAGQPEFRDARVVMAYLSIPGEADTAELIRAALREGKTVLAPKLDRSRRRMDAVRLESLEAGLTVGAFGIREPAVGGPHPPGEIDLIVVPALGYDRSGNRLGRGGGYYDRFLARRRIRAVRCGLAFDEQLVERVPVAPHDRPVDMLVTDKEVLRFGAEGARGAPRQAPAAKQGKER